MDIASPDGMPIRVLFLCATPSTSLDLPLPLFSSIAESFSREGVLENAIAARNLTEFVAAVRPPSNE
jgi:hypothetical protein